MRTLRSLLLLLLLAAPVAGQDTIRTRTPVTVVPIADTTVLERTDTVEVVRADTVFVASDGIRVVCVERQREWFRWSDWTVADCPEDVPIDIPPGDIEQPQDPDDEPDEPQEPEEPADPPTDPQPPTDPAGAWYVQDWATVSGPGMEVIASSGGLGQVSAVTVDGPGFSRAMRATYNPGGGEVSAGVTLTLPGAEREIWIEFYARFSPNWSTNGPHAGNPDHKFLFLFDQTPSGSRRWESNIGVFGDQIGHYIAGNGLNYPGGSRLWDGLWHRFRYHARMDGPVWEVWIDGQRYQWSGSRDFSGFHFKYLALSRNMNRGVRERMHLDFGPVRVWATNPGW